MSTLFKLIRSFTAFPVNPVSFQCFLFFPPNMDANNRCLTFILHITSSFHTEIGAIPQYKVSQILKDLPVEIIFSISFP